MEVLIASSQKGPHGAGSLVDVALLSLTGVVGQERAVETGVCVLHQLYLDGQDSLHRAWAASPHPGLRLTDLPGSRTYQERFIKLKQAGKLLEQLVNRIEPLEEHRALLVLVLCVLLVATAVSKLVPKIQPVRFY